MKSVDGFLQRTKIAYLTMEIAIRAEMHTYAGGLGMLAGDAARSSADLDLPIVFVTLASHEGYLRQEIGPEGQQIAFPDPWDPATVASPLDTVVSVEIEGRRVWIAAWLYELTCPLGHTLPVLLLDTRLQQNAASDQSITDRLYGGDDIERLKQEIVLGIGGERMLRALGFEIETYHLNEGHAALLPLALLKRHTRLSTHTDDAAPRYDSDLVRRHCIFTTHTPVAAGHDRFAYSDVQRLLGDFIELDELKALAGRDGLNMTKLALNLSGFINGVADRHATTARSMYPGYSIRAITNGVHLPTWTHPAFARLYDTIAPHWAHEPEVLINADGLSDDSVWAAHQEAKASLIGEIARRTNVAMSPDVPIISFARRMTGYKRPDLLLSDPARLKAICSRYPFQLVFAGKAHPRDEPGKVLIRQIHGQLAELGLPVATAFLPNYDMDLAKSLVAGTDVWLNTPMPPLEASGTSGMKAALNGVLNMSVPDGWWGEGWREGITGWSIGAGNVDSAIHDAEELYDKLENVVLPMYYDSRARWIGMMKQAFSKIGSRFNSHRMMRRYAAEAYLR